MKLYDLSVICFIILNYMTISCAHNTTFSNDSLKQNVTDSVIPEIQDPVDNYKLTHTRKCFHLKKNYQKNYFGSFSQRKSNLAYLRDIPFEPLRIYFDYSLTLPHEEKMIKELIMPPVKKFFENTLSVRRLIGKLRVPKSLKSCQDIPIPSFLYNQGVEADLVIIVSTYRGMKKFNYEKYMKSLRNNRTSKPRSHKNNQNFAKDNNHSNSNENQNTDIHLNNFLQNFFKTKPFRKNALKNNFHSNNNNSTNILSLSSDIDKTKDENRNSTKPKPKVLPWEINDGPADVVGWSATCLQDLYTLRPIAGVMQYVADINPTPRAIEEAIWTTLHEITHVLAMDYDLMGDFIDSNFNRKGYADILKIKTKLVGLADLMEERQEIMDDYFAFANFNNFTDDDLTKIDLNEELKNTSLYIYGNKTKADKSKKFSLRRDLDLESKISAFDKINFKQVEFSTKSEDVFESETKSDMKDDEHSDFNSFSVNNYKEKEEKSKNDNAHEDEILKSPNEIEKNAEEEPKSEFKIKFNKLKKLRLKNFNLFKEANIKDYENKIIIEGKNKQLAPENNIEKEEGSDENTQNFKIEFNHGISRIFETISKENEKEKGQRKSVFILPEDKNYFNISLKNNTSFDNQVTNSTKSFKNSNKSEFEDEDALSDFPLILPDSASNDLFLTLEKLQKFKKIKMPVQENFEEIKVPKNFNLTVLLMYIENFSENTKIFIKTPKVVETGKKHFACDSLDGVELEHFGGMGSAYSHWSKRALNTEYMIADSYGENYISNFTLAILEDSGWYRVDYSKSEIVPWGKGKGCDFLAEKCIHRKQVKSYFTSVMSRKVDSNVLMNNNQNNINTTYTRSNKDSSSSDLVEIKSNVTNENYSSMNLNNNNENYLSFNHNSNTISEARFNREFCTSVNEEECSITHVFRAVCGVNRHQEEIPKQYQYFDDPKIAGITPFGDYCPYPVEWFDITQMKPVGSCKNGIQLRPGLGEKICENCRCFLSSLVNEKLYEKEFKSKVKNYKNLDENRAACYEAKCKIGENNKLRLIVFIEEYEIKCPRNGGILTIEGYKGFINCPKADDVCFGIMDPRNDFSVTSAYGLFSNITERLLNIMYDFIYSFFNNVNNSKN